MCIKLTEYGFAVTDENGDLAEFYGFLCSDPVWDVFESEYTLVKKAE